MEGATTLPSTPNPAVEQDGEGGDQPQESVGNKTVAADPASASAAAGEKEGEREEVQQTSAPTPDGDHLAPASTAAGEGEECEGGAGEHAPEAAVEGTVQATEMCVGAASTSPTSSPCASTQTILELATAIVETPPAPAASGEEERNRGAVDHELPASAVAGEEAEEGGGGGRQAPSPAPVIDTFPAPAAAVSVVEAATEEKVRRQVAEYALPASAAAVGEEEEKAGKGVSETPRSVVKTAPASPAPAAMVEEEQEESEGVRQAPLTRPAPAAVP